MGALTAWGFAGQGSQRKGMGAAMFERFPERCAAADAILGYSIRDLCIDNRDGHLRQTQYAQPAIYVVGALSALAITDAAPHFVAGHSVGEYAALFAAGCFDFETGLRLVQKRGELMARTQGGGMVAVIGLGPERVAEILAAHALADIDVANKNLRQQVVLSGPRASLPAASQALERAGARCVALDVSAAFHSRYMAEAAVAFGDYLRSFRFAEPRVPVISNVTAEPYTGGTIATLLTKQITAPVRWYDSMLYLFRHGVGELREIGATRVLIELWRTAREQAPPAPAPNGLPPTLIHARPAPNGLPPTLIHARPAPNGLSPTLIHAKPAQIDPRPTPSYLRSATIDPKPIPNGARPAPNGARPAPNGARPAPNGETPVPNRETPVPVVAKPAGSMDAEHLGSAAFRRDHGLRYAYLAGSMFRGVASVALVVRMANAGLMGFLGTGGLALEEIDAALGEIRRALGPAGRYGANLLHQMDNADAERAIVALYLRHDVRCIEAAAYMQITPALVHYRFSGAHASADGRATTPRRVVAKVSRPEVALAFMQPAPDAIVRRLVEEGALTPDEAEAARRLPISQDICVESDSAGHTDGGVALTLLPVMTRLRDEAMQRYRYPDPLRIGGSGGLGAPEAVAAAFLLGADFVVTGSVNQCSPEAGTSAPVKDLLAMLDVQDTGYAPAGDMFELGARVQAVRKGTLFTARANKLYQLYRQYESLEAIDSRTRHTIESTWFRRSFDDVWQDTRDYYAQTGRPGEVERAERNPKHRMALVFRWYFAHSIRVALDGDLNERVNFQIHCGPAMGAFNRFVRGTDLQDWQSRHVDVIADRLMHGAAAVLRRSSASLGKQDR